MALKRVHKKQILAMNNCQFYCFNVKYVLAKRFEKFPSALSTPVCAHTFFSSPPSPPPPARNLESECNIYPPPPHGASSEYIPCGFHFRTWSVNSYQQAKHYVSSIVYYQWYESLQREGRKIALHFAAHGFRLSHTLNKLCPPLFSGYDQSPSILTKQ